MERCCVKGCDSYHNRSKNIGYFQFPLHDEILLKKWLRQIDQLNWTPSSYHRICSMHFREQDLIGYPNRKESYLKLTSIPTIFPSQPVEIVKPKETNNSNCPTISLHSKLGLGKFVNFVGWNSLSKTNPLILIPSEFSQHLEAHYPIDIIEQRSNENCVQDSMEHISCQYLEDIGAQSPHILLHNSVDYIKHRQMLVKDQWHTKHIDSDSCLVITNNCVEMSAQSGNIVQHSMQSANQFLALPISQVINKQYIKQEELKIIEPLGSQMLNRQPRLRKILPKPQSLNPNNTLPAVTVMQKCQSKFMTNSIPKPDILIIPRIEAGRDNLSRYPVNKKPILRITIDKEYGLKETTARLSHQVQKRCLKSNAKINIGLIEKSLRQTEITIENSSTNKAVTFKLDSITGEIIMSTRQLDEFTRDDSAPKFTKTKRKVHDTTIPSAPNLRQLYIKGQQDCIVLRKRLRALRQRHKQEQEEIVKLQQHLTKLGDEGENTWGQEPLTSLSCKRKKRENSRMELDEYESMFHQVKKMKHELQTDVCVC